MVPSRGSDSCSRNHCRTTSHVEEMMLRLRFPGRAVSKCSAKHAKREVLQIGTQVTSPSSDTWHRDYPIC